MKTCPSCGNVWGDEYTYCGACGHKFEEEGTTTAFSEPEQQTPEQEEFYPQSAPREPEPDLSYVQPGFPKDEQSNAQSRGTINFSKPEQQAPETEIHKTPGSQGGYPNSAPPQSEPARPYIEPEPPRPEENGPQYGKQDTYRPEQNDYSAPNYDRVPENPFGNPVTTPQINRLAIAALVVGILSLVFVCCRKAGVLFGVIAIVLSIYGRRSIHSSNGRETGLGFCTTGLICGILSVVLMIAATVVNKMMDVPINWF